MLKVRIFKYLKREKKWNAKKLINVQTFVFVWIVGLTIIYYAKQLLKLKLKKQIDWFKLYNLRLIKNNNS